VIYSLHIRNILVIILHTY